MSERDARTAVIGETLLEAEFDPGIAGHGRWLWSLVLLSTVAGVVLIPFWLAFSLWYYPEFLRRLSARLTTEAVEIRKGVFFRKETTIPLDRITDVRLHDGPIMRHYGLGGLRVETAGQAGQAARSEGNLIGVVDAPAFRDAILTQRRQVLGSAPASATPPAAPPASGDDALLAEIRDILTRIEAQGRGR